jgi:hypothetical protein
MMKKLRISAVCGLLACVVVLAFGADTCHGQGCAPGAYSYLYAYYPGIYGAYSRGLQRDIPHFAAFPPVYYSHVVPRPYGYSPYAYVPGVVAPGFELCQPRHRCAGIDGAAGAYRPLRDISPLVQGRAPASTRTAPRPVSIANPYFSPTKVEDSGTERVSRAGKRIQNPYFAEGASSITGG